jgi:hypothetical protein
MPVAIERPEAPLRLTVAKSDVVDSRASDLQKLRFFHFRKPLGWLDQPELGMFVPKAFCGKPRRKIILAGIIPPLLGNSHRLSPIFREIIVRFLRALPRVDL